MGARTYGVVGGAVIVVLLMGLGSTTGIGALGTVDPHGPLLSVPSANSTHANQPQAMPSLTPDFTLHGLSIPSWVTTAVMVLGTGLLLLLLGWFIWRVTREVQRGRRVAAAAASTEGTELEEIPMSALAETVEESLEDLRSGMGTDDAILECWRRLEALGQGAGAPRHDSDTSTEYVERLLVGVPQAGGDLAILARLYRSAMFSGLASDPEARGVAIACLERLAQTLGEGATRGA